jgi:hypothetical protein
LDDRASLEPSDGSTEKENKKKLEEKIEGNSIGVMWCDASLRGSKVTEQSS